MSPKNSTSLRRLLSATALSAAALGMSLQASPSFANTAGSATPTTSATVGLPQMGQRAPLMPAPRRSVRAGARGQE